MSYKADLSPFHVSPDLLYTERGGKLWIPSDEETSFSIYLVVTGRVFWSDPVSQGETRATLTKHTSPHVLFLFIDCPPATWGNLYKHYTFVFTLGKTAKGSWCQDGWMKLSLIEWMCKAQNLHHSSDEWNSVAEQERSMHNKYWSHFCKHKTTNPSLTAQQKSNFWAHQLLSDNNMCMKMMPMIGWSGVARG